MARIKSIFELPTRPCWVDGRRAIFHRWTDSARSAKPRGLEEDDDAQRFQLHSVHALVEYEDGTVSRVWPNAVQFADSEQLFMECDWEAMERQRDALPYTYDQETPAETKRPLKTCLNCGAPTQSCDLDCHACKKTDPHSCRCRVCVDGSLWVPKVGSARG